MGDRSKVFGAFTAAYGEKVTVRGSSAVEASCWLDIDSAENKNDYTGGKRIEVCAHLSLPQAIVLRAALDSYIAEASEEEG